MPNIRGGSGYKKYKNNRHNGDTDTKEITFANGTSQYYGFVTNKLGSGRFYVNIVTSQKMDPESKMAFLRGKLKKNKYKCFVSVGDFVLLEAVDSTKYEIMDKYSTQEVDVLRSHNEIYTDMDQNMFMSHVNALVNEEKEEPQDEWVDLEDL
jgi:translation initiation factor IF-1